MQFGWLFASAGLVLSVVAACSAANGGGGGLETNGGGGEGGHKTHDPTSVGGGIVLPDAGSPETCLPCSLDLTKVVDCAGDGHVVEVCKDGKVCGGGECLEPCAAAEANKSSVGCAYYAVQLDGIDKADQGCFTAFIANTSDKPAHIEAKFGSTVLDVEAFTRIPAGSGQALTYAPYDATAGLAPSEVAILFLGGGGPDGAECPVPPAQPFAQLKGTTRGKTFHLTTDVPVVAYQMLPYGAGKAAVTGATLLLPTSTWDTNYIAVNAYARSQIAGVPSQPPLLTIVAAEDGTEVKILPKVAIESGLSVEGSPANVPVTYAMSKGEALQIVQLEELSGSPIESNKPIGFWAGHRCMTVPANVSFCDHAEQQMPPVRALGSKYVAVSYRARSAVPEHPRYRVIGAVDGTKLDYDPPIGGAPDTLNQGDVIEFFSDDPFVVTSQNEAHPFLLVTYMTGSKAVEELYGDPDFVRVVPADQYLGNYVFFTDPTYPETNLVVVRKKGKKGFADVELDCAGVLGDWAPVGTSGQFEFTRIDLIRHDFEPQGDCDNGRHRMTSDAPFGLWVWGWGTPEVDVPITEKQPVNVSYGYPAGESVRPINQVVVPPSPH